MNSNAKVAIVTGAGSGIGKRTALAFLTEGYAVALAGRRKKPLETTAAESGSQPVFTDKRNLWRLRRLV
jgi:NADP-dependent 3-hydroxy acid dehydrogenase YdfG